VTTESGETVSRSHTGFRGRGGTVTRGRTGTGIVGGGLEAGRRATGRVRRAFVAVGVWLRETVTPLGWFLLGLVACSMAAAIGLGWVEAWVVTIGAGLLLLVSVPFLLGGTTMDVELILDRDRVVAGNDVGARLAISNRSQRIALPGVIDVPVGDGLVEAHVPLLLGSAVHVEELVIGAHRRGVITVGPMTIARGDPIGILRREVSWPQVEQIHVHPVTVRLPSTSAGYVKDIDGTPSKQIVDSDLAFHAIRDYQPGDSHRHVHWKATAKTGTLMIRQFEESRRSRLGIILDVDPAGYVDEDEFELGVSVAASLGLQGVRDGRDVLMATASPRAASARDASTSVRTLPTLTPGALMDGTSTIDQDPSAPRIEHVVSLTTQSFSDLSIVFVITGGLVPLTRVRRAAFGVPPGVTAVVVRAESGAEPKSQQVGGFSIMTVGVLGDLRHLVARGGL
jgi:uncharacterized protein (DUF58 family)